MSILNQLASALNRRDEELNEQLAIRLCTESSSRDVGEDIQELVDNLQNKNKQIRSDCIKVLYEIGAINPELITNYVDEFVTLLSHKDNRLVWGGMTALGSIVSLRVKEIGEHIDTIIEATENGSVITQDWGIRVLATLSANDSDYAKRIYPFLMDFLKNCRPKDVPRHGESILLTVKSETQKEQFLNILESHQPELKASQLKRVEKLIRQL